MKNKKKTLLEFIAVFLFLYFLLKHLNDGERLLFLIKRSEGEYLLLALVSQIAYYIFYACLYQKAFNIYGVVWPLKRMLRLILSATALGLVAPLGSLAGAGIFVHSAKKDKLPSIAVGAGLFVAVFADFFALFLFLTLSMLFLVFHHNLFKYELLGYAVFASMVASLTLFAVLGFRNVGVLRSVLKFFQAVVNKFGSFANQIFLPQDWFERKAGEFKEVSSKLAGAKYRFGNLIVLAVLMRMFGIITLFFLFLAFQHLVRATPLFIGYSVGALFLIVSPTPQGIGIVESVMPVVFSSLGVDIETATLVTLVFRGLTVWFPALFGFIALKAIARKS